MDRRPPGYRRSMLYAFPAILLVVAIALFVAGVTVGGVVIAVAAVLVAGYALFNGSRPKL